MIELFVYCAVGRVCIFLLQKFPFHKLQFIGRWFMEGGFLHDLFQCDLCLGVWVYTILAGLFRFNLLHEFFYFPVISELVTGGVMSFIVHLLRVGFETQFSVIEVK